MHLRQNPDLNLKKWIIKKHVENYEFKKYKKFLNTYIKMEKTIMKFGDSEIRKEMAYFNKQY